VSPDFLGSDFIYTHEFGPLLEDSRKRGLTLFPIAVRPSSYELLQGLPNLQFANDPARPLSDLRPSDRDRALVDITKKIAQALEVSSVSNALRALDAASYQASGLGGTAPAEAGLQGLGAYAVQDAAGLHLRSPAGAQAVLRWEDIQRLDTEARRWIYAQDSVIQELYDRWLQAWPQRAARDTQVREDVQRTLSELRTRLCDEFKALLNFFERAGWHLDDHYLAVRDICSQTFSF